MRRSKGHQTPVLLVMISLLIVVSMALSMVWILTPPRRVVPSPTPTFAPFPTDTPTPPPA